MNTGKVTKSKILCRRKKQSSYKTANLVFHKTMQKYTVSIPEMVIHVVLHSLYMENENQIVFYSVYHNLRYSECAHTHTVSPKMNCLYQDAVVAMTWTCQYLQDINMPHETHICIYFWTVSKSCHLYTSPLQILWDTYKYKHKCSLPSHAKCSGTMLIWFINWVS
jgi:hypothetical protein